jgi:hypothetical protein
VRELLATVLSVWALAFALLIFWFAMRRLRRPAGPARLGDVHDTDSTECWCEPELLQACPEWSRMTGDRCPESCHLCHGKTMVAPYDFDEPLVIVHRRNVVRG